MRSPFSKLAARSRMSWSLRKSSQSEESEVSHQQNAGLDHCPDCTAEKMIKNDALMESLYVLLDQDHPQSPLYHSPFKVKNSDVARWADSVSPFVSSPIDIALPDNTNRDKSTKKSTSTLSSAGSLLSESSSCEESKGPKTPTFAHEADLFLPRGMPNADVGLAAKPFISSQPATIGAEPKIHRAFSFELIPEAPFRPAPPPPSNNTRNETAANALIESSNTPSCPTPPAVLECQATITTLIDDFMPEYIPSPQITPAKKKASFPLLRIDTRGFHTPIQQVGRPEIPEIELSPPAIHVGEMLSLGYKAYSESRVEQERTLLSFSEREVSSSRHSIANPIPRKNLNYDDYRKGATRYSVQAPSKRLLNDLQERKLMIPTNYKPYSAPQPILRQNPAEFELHVSLEQKLAPVKYTPYSAPKTPPKRTKAEIEAIPAALASSAKYEEPVAFATNRGAFFTGGFFAKEQGLQLRMTRMVTTFSKMEWAIQDLSGSRMLKCFAQTNSLSRRKDFWDPEGNLLFNFQKKIGSTRIAETPCRTEAFSVQNASLPSMPHWTVKLASSINDSAAQWDARGDEDMETVIVNWGGFEVGRIRCESRQRKHTYIVSIAAEMNYAVLAALTTVFDDLRTDEGC